MSGFVDSIVSRFNGAENTISPRLPGKFEFSNCYESNLFGETSPSVVLDEQTTTDYYSDAEHSVNKVSNQLNASHTGSDLETNDFSVFNESKQHRSITESTESDQEQRQGIQVENRANRYVLPSHINKEHSGDLYKPNEHRQASKESSDIDCSRAKMVPGSVRHMIEKEKQRNEIRQPFISPIVGKAPIRNNESVPDLNFQKEVGRNEAPVIKISIGRIEVRAAPVTNATTSKQRAAQKPQMSLEDYLQKRNKGQ